MWNNFVGSIFFGHNCHLLPNFWFNMVSKSCMEKKIPILWFNFGKNTCDPKRFLLTIYEETYLLIVTTCKLFQTTSLWQPFWPQIDHIHDSLKLDEKSKAMVIVFVIEVEHNEAQIQKYWPWSIKHNLNLAEIFKKYCEITYFLHFLKCFVKIQSTCNLAKNPLQWSNVVATAITTPIMASDFKRAWTVSLNFFGNGSIGALEESVTDPGDSRVGLLAASWLPPSSTDVLSTLPLQWKQNNRDWYKKKDSVPEIEHY